MSDQTAPPQTGYAPVNGLQMYYEIHGSGGTPLLLLHGGLFKTSTRGATSVLSLESCC